jgi:hypothetical protein
VLVSYYSSGWQNSNHRPSWKTDLVFRAAAPSKTVTMEGNASISHNISTAETDLTESQQAQPQHPPINNHQRSPTTPNNRTMMMPILSQDNSQKKRFAVFVKILFKELGRSEDRAELREMAKTIVLDCTRRNRLGDPAYRPLMDAIDRRLRRHVGESHWRRAHLYLQHYMKQDALREGRSLVVRTAIV